MDKREAEAYRRLQDENIKLREKLEALQAEIKGSPPTREQFDKMNYHKRVVFKEQYPELYAQYTK